MPPAPRIAAAAALLIAAMSASGCVRDAATASGDLQAPPLAPTPTPVPDHSAFVGAVDALAADALQQGPIAGLSIAVVERGTPILARGYGFADLEAGLPATLDTSYPIASVSKHFTAALVLRLVDEGRLGLDDPMSRFFPDARPKIGALTMRHLLDHTSGLTRGGPAPRGAALNVVRRGGTAHDQGEKWDYSNYNYSLLGLVIERVTGREYASYVHDELVARLGLSGTGYCEDGTMVPGRGRDYLSGRKRVSPTAYWMEPRFFASGGLCSTVLDLVRWEQALESGRVVRPDTLKVMRTPARLPGAVDADYGLGTRMGWTAGRRKIGHTGGGQGNKAVLARYPEEDLTVVVLLNTERDKALVTATDLEERIARLYFAGRDAAAVAAEAPGDPQRYAGQYREGTRLVSVTTDAGIILMRPGLQHRTESQLIAARGLELVSADDPSIALRFQVQDEQALAYGRYRNGWFAGLAVRSSEPPPPRGGR